ncbi:PREDICTED: uncharacterized protein LOC109582830 [Amphimedon queenslandica]|uniref:Uncharacterized protein n=1 Tax=Amphimedon queenslandica TaxID=400682 RepID=A0A1X7UM69_AMPQE|nr:PREDICTED: uncharacterized protein LOC109582830 [Amphimedon queenslandica]|eukprot:XP_019853374.1 PREDICTED: uncharacterized protein LOC109582830 [Amphimedon queenslandica]
MGHFSVLILIHILLILRPVEGENNDGHCYDHDESSCSKKGSLKKEETAVNTGGFSFWGAFKKVGRAAINKVHDFSMEVANNIGEILRTVINEEALNATISAGKDALSQIFDSNNTVTAVGSKVLSVSILVGVMFINYFLIHYFSLLSLLTLDAGIALLHGIFGPLQIIIWFITGCSLISQGLLYTLYYPQFSATLLILLFIFSCCCWPYLRRQSRYLRNSSDTVFVIEAQLERLEAHLAQRKERDKEIKAQLDRIEGILEKDSP